MRREIARTIRSLSPAMQRGIDATAYELIVVDNGSDEPVDRDACAELGAPVRWIDIGRASPSPAAALNRGIREARAPLVGAMVDGARLASPGLLRLALVASRLHPRAGTSSERRRSWIQRIRSRCRSMNQSSRSSLDLESSGHIVGPLWPDSRRFRSNALIEI